MPARCALQGFPWVQGISKQQAGTPNSAVTGKPSTAILLDACLRDLWVMSLFLAGAALIRQLESNAGLPNLASATLHAARRALTVSSFACGQSSQHLSASR